MIEEIKELIDLNEIHITFNGCKGGWNVLMIGRSKQGETISVTVHHPRIQGIEEMLCSLRKINSHL